ncbi:hypothetical protein V8C34DRAFT_256091 [Trichoderma compactum]
MAGTYQIVMPWESGGMASFIITGIISFPFFSPFFFCEIRNIIFMIRPYKMGLMELLYAAHYTRRWRLRRGVSVKLLGQLRWRQTVDQSHQQQFCLFALPFTDKALGTCIEPDVLVAHHDSGTLSCVLFTGVHPHAHIQNRYLAGYEHVRAAICRHDHCDCYPPASCPCTSYGAHYCGQIFRSAPSAY